MLVLTPPRQGGPAVAHSGPAASGAGRLTLITGRLGSPMVLAPCASAARPALGETRAVAGAGGTVLMCRHADMASAVQRRVFYGALSGRTPVATTRQCRSPHRRQDLTGRCISVHRDRPTSAPVQRDRSSMPVRDLIIAAAAVRPPSPAWPSTAPRFCRHPARPSAAPSPAHARLRGQAQRRHPQATVPCLEGPGQRPRLISTSSSAHPRSARTGTCTTAS